MLVSQESCSLGGTQRYSLKKHLSKTARETRQNPQIRLMVRAMSLRPNKEATGGFDGKASNL
jgi:hypothetical protein